VIETIVILVVLVAIHIKWAKKRIQSWALQNNYKIEKCSLSFFDIGPFSYFGTSGGQYVFKIEAVNFEGKRRIGYARAGGFFFGLLRERVKVKWNKSILDI